MITRRNTILAQRESLTRAAGVLTTMAASFFDDDALGKDDRAASMEVGTQCLEAADTILNLLRYAGLSDADIVSIGESVDQEQEALTKLSGEVAP